MALLATGIADAAELCLRFHAILFVMALCTALEAHRFLWRAIPRAVAHDTAVEALWQRAIASTVELVADLAGACLGAAAFHVVRRIAAPAFRHPAVSIGVASSSTHGACCRISAVRCNVATPATVVTLAVQVAIVGDMRSSAQLACGVGALRCPVVGGLPTGPAIRPWAVPSFMVFFADQAAQGARCGGPVLPELGVVRAGGLASWGHGTRAWDHGRMLRAPV